MIYQKIAKHLLLPWYYRRGDNRSLERLAELEKTQYLAPDEIRSRQLAALKKLLLHCQANVPFYRERFAAAGFDPATFSEVSQLKRIPYLTKQDLQNNLDRLVASNFDKESLVLDASGGSTGKPTNFYKDRRRYLDSRGDQLRHDRWCGWDVGEKCVKLWGAQREFDEQPSLKSQLVEKWVHRIYSFNAFDISEAKVLRYLEELRSIRPTMILAYSNVAFFFANVIQRHGIDLAPLHLKGVICSAETLTEEKRAAIESAFHCKVLNRYGSREVGLVASECLEQKGLHINCDNVFVEIEKGGSSAAPGELGEIVVTDLWNYGMPFIRYQMGDVGILGAESCPCGRHLPLITDVQGRVSDFLIDFRGGLVHGEYFTHLFYGVQGVEQFQLVQESRDLALLRLLPGPNFEVRSLDPIVEKIKACLGDEVQVAVELCSESLVEASGKFRFTISKIANGYFQG